MKTGQADAGTVDGRPINIKLPRDMTPTTMRSERSPIIVTIAFICALVISAVVASVAITRQASQAVQAHDVQGDGQHDFDFNFGTWKTHVSRLLQPLSGLSSWAKYDGTSLVSKVWSGHAKLSELEVDGPAGRIEGAGLRLYNPQSHQWSLNWASSRDGEKQPPMIGQFAGGRGQFGDHVINGKSVLVRRTFSDISRDFARFEPAVSADGIGELDHNVCAPFRERSYN